MSYPPDVELALATAHESPRHAVKAGFILGIEHAARILEAVATEQTDALAADLDPADVMRVAAALVRNQGVVAADSFAMTPKWLAR